MTLLRISEIESDEQSKDECKHNTAPDTVSQDGKCLMDEMG